ncbi:NADH dehydrogenase subunit K [Leptospira ryugenii]|uniref:NADH-quinone oxidoreductase subunit K n=1 Tax=Leptospira ryugenii TaxID=1917863 RepID=A0A2P2DYB7_9LEPT|nr:NADH-quinone oxidoreductase subunit NuoK [Leptospira ryugenii]GBF49613.1 NADH dehydrogenase subunit K [Leptospira ryugenii]
MNALISGIPSVYFLALAGILFSIGLVGVLIRRNAVIIFMSVELILNAVNLVFVTFSKTLLNVSGEVIVFFVMAIAACEAAIGLALVIAIFRQNKSSNVDELQSLKW